jgi:hypothetical protein
MKPCTSLALAAGLLGLSGAASADLQVLSSSGADASAIQSTVNSFRSALGGANNGVNAHAGSDGRREINWDAVPAGFSAPNNLPADFFNKNSQRGLQLVSVPGGSGFMVSDSTAGGAGSNGSGERFDNLLAGYSSQFTTFSAQKLFTSLGSPVYDVIFFVPLARPGVAGSTRAVVSGFGSVFADVDVAGTTSMQFFDINDVSLGAFAASPAGNGLSFLGAYDTSGPAQIARVRITLGNTAIGIADNNGSHDIVVADDFIYGEPIAAAVPEPASAALFVLGATALWVRRRR